MNVRVSIGGALWLLVLVIRAAAAPQTPAEPKKDATMRSTLAGVYTTAQADKGKSAFLNICVGCHNVGSQAGQPFAIRWGGRPLSDLYDFLRENMPDDDPQSVSPAVKLQIVTYLLRLNGMPAGQDDLPGDVDALKKIKIEIPPSHSERSPWHDE